MRIREVKAAADELVNIPRQLNMVLAAAFIAMILCTAAVLVVALKEK